MYSLLGDRFLKQFFGSRLHQPRVNPASELPTDDTDKLDEAGYAAGVYPLDTDATLENEPTGVINQLTVPENGSGQTTSDNHPLTAEECRK